MDRDQTVYDWLHYVLLIERKPGALRNGTPFGGLPDAPRTHHLTKFGREVPQAPCSVYFEEPQWRALMIFTSADATAPGEPPTLHEAMHRVAALGGFLGRHRDGEPGTQTLWRGLQRLDDITAMYIQMKDATHPPCPAGSILGKDQGRAGGFTMAAP